MASAKRRPPGSTTRPPARGRAARRRRLGRPSGHLHGVRIVCVVLPSTKRPPSCRSAACNHCRTCGGYGDFAHRFGESPDAYRRCAARGSAKMREGTITLTDGRTLGFAEHGVEGGIPVFYCHGNPGGRFLAHERRSSNSIEAAGCASSRRPRGRGGRHCRIATEESARSSGSTAEQHTGRRTSTMTRSAIAERAPPERGSGRATASDASHASNTRDSRVPRPRRNDPARTCP